MFRGLIVACVLASSAQAQAPRSAIDWLSESLLQPPNFVITPPLKNTPSFDTGISVVPLDQISREAVGLLPANSTGFPVNLWQGLNSAQAADLLSQISAGPIPEVQSLYRQVLLAQSNPPKSDDPSTSLLLTRIDLLVGMGALEEAEALIRLAGATEPEIFRRWFEITLIGQRTRAPCSALREQPTLSTDVATRTICLARSGDWNAAALTVSLAESLGSVSQKDADLLVRFLDPEMFSNLPDPGNPVPLDAITFALRESLGLPRPESGLSLPYLNADMNLRTPARQRILAAERLVRANAVPVPLVFAAYRGARAASSGGVWGRAELVQALDKALINEDEAALALAFMEAMVAFQDAGLIHAFALEYADALAHYPPDPETGQVAQHIRKVLLLANRPIAVWVGIGPENSAEMELAIQLASHTTISGISPYDNQISNAIHAAFSNLTPSRRELPELLAQIDSGEFGIVLLRAIDLLSNGQAADPRDLHEGLFLLIKLGLDTSARRIAIQLLLLEPAPA